jgi:dTDP-4-amino-4,6-dideoxy-D-galactose acyltransferase
MLEILPWDSQFFGFGVGRLRAESLTPSVVLTARHWCHTHHVSCLYYLGPEESRVPEGFLWVDERVTYHWDAQDRVAAESTPDVRPFESGDLETLETIARRSHRDSRFYSDPSFDRTRCDELYATWIRRSCGTGGGRADAVFVATYQERPCGYVTCDGNSIGLIAVAESAQGRGLGKQLVTAAQQHFLSRGVGRAQVVTQGRNQAARRLYLSRGFKAAEAQHWYHLHV